MNVAVAVLILLLSTHTYTLALPLTPTTESNASYPLLYHHHYLHPHASALSLFFFSVTTLVPTIDPLQLLYGTLNKLLRDEDRSKLKPFFPYLKLLLTALQRLPNIKQMVGWDAMW